jgi:hypothetical protein
MYYLNQTEEGCSWELHIVNVSSAVPGVICRVLCTGGNLSVNYRSAVDVRYFNM